MTFNEIYSSLSFDLLRHIRRGGSRDWSEDVFQDVMLAYSRRAKDLSTLTPVQIKAYLIRTANRCAEKYRRGDFADCDGVDEMPAPEVEEEAVDAIAPPGLRRLACLRFRCGMTVAEVARRVGVSDRTIRYRMARARGAARSST